MNWLSDISRGLCLTGLLAGVSLADSRVFMTRPGEKGIVPTTGSHTVVMSPGGTVALEVWVDGTSPNLLGGYQVGMPGSATLVGGSGTVTYLDRPAPPGTGDSVAINTADPDWVYAGQAGVQAFVSEVGLPVGFGFLAGMPLGTGVEVTALSYLGQFEYEASGDAHGTFVLDFLPPDAPPDGGTGLIDETSTAQIPSVLQRLIIKVGDPPINDECNGAVPISLGDNLFDTSTATTSLPNDGFGGPGNAVCADGGIDTIENDGWFEYVAECDATLTVSTCNQADFDTRLEVYSGCGLCPPSNLIHCSDDEVGCGGGTSEVTFTMSEGTCYTIRLGGEDELGLGSGTLSLIPSGGCFIGGTCYAPDANNPVNDCEFCDPAQGATGWSNRIAGSLCADEGNDCTQNVCNGAGICTHPLELAGTPCGNPSDTFCTDPDTCDGAGTCLTFNGPNGLPCPNGLFCDGDETCLNGACTDGPDPCISPDFCNEVTETCLECMEASDCADVDLDGITDDHCKWYECVGGCNAIDRIFADAGGAFGACQPDGFTNVHDWNHALRCFMGTGCEQVNVDVGGAFQSCVSDGFCNIHDGLHAKTAFSGTNVCSCPANGARGVPVQEPVAVAEAMLKVMPTRRAVRPGDDVEVHVFVREPLEDLQSYQLHLGVSGGNRGELELIDIVIENRRDYAFSGLPDATEAVNAVTAQMFCALQAGGVITRGDRYLATYIYRATADASGVFVVDVLHDAFQLDQTFLIASFSERIAVASSVPGVIVVSRPADSGLR